MTYVRYDHPDDRSTEVVGDVLIKTGPPKTMRLEVVKTEAARRVGEETGLFHVPEILAHDVKEGRVSYRLVRDVEPVGFVETAERLGEGLPERIGEAAAAVHRLLHLPDEFNRRLPSDLLWPKVPEVTLHGDLTGRNILVRRKDGALFLTDWVTSYRIGETNTLGPPWFDLGWFVRWQHLRAGARPVPSAARRACTRMLIRYLACNPCGSLSDFGAYLLHMSQCDRRRRNVCFPLKRRVAMLMGDLCLFWYAWRLARGHGELPT